MFSWDLLANAVVAGVLLGGFYAAVSLGVSLTFGLLDVVNIAHPAFVILGSYAAYAMNSSFGLDPILTGMRSEEHTSELQSHSDLVCRLLLEKKKKNITILQHSDDYSCK